jgi:hypothetical protein
MNKTNETTSEFEQEIQAALFVPEAEAEFVAGLRRQILAKGRPRTAARRGFFLRPAWVGALVALLLVAVLLLAAGPQRVWAAVRSLFGYVPGVGFVAGDLPLRILDGPVILERDGITLTVKEGLADANRTNLVYTVEGIRQEQRPHTEADPGCAFGDFLRLQDGTRLELTGGGGNGWPSGYESRAVFPAIPAQGEAVTLVIPCLLDTVTAGTPENWEIALRFVPAPPDYQVLPVIELPTSTPAVVELTIPAPETAAVTPATGPVIENPLEGILVVERMVELENGYLFQGAFSWQDTGDAVAHFDSYRLEVFDANGQKVPVEPDYDSLSEISLPTQRSQPWALRTNTKALAGPLTIRLPFMETQKKVQEQFDIDLGTSPQPGLKLELDRDFNLEGKDVRILSVELGFGRDGLYSLTFELQADPAFFSGISLSDPDSNSPGGGGGGNRSGSITQSILYPTLPQGVRHIYINRISYLMSGPWSAQVDLPAGQGATVDSQPQACLAPASWESLKAIPISPAPESLQQGVLVEDPAKEGMTFSTMYVVHPDGSPAVKVGSGGWGALSPDGTRVAFMNTDGLQLADLRSGQVTGLGWAGANAYHPVWSADGLQIAFVRGMEGIFTSRLDGAGLQKVPGTGSDSSLFGWLLDGKHLVLGTSGAEGALVQTVDIASGQAEALFTLNSHKGGNALVSPDGQSIAFNEPLFGGGVGTFLSALDGSERRQVAQTDGRVSFRLAGWSPDSQRIFLFAEDPNYLEQAQVFLIRLGDCEVIHLQGVGGD